MREVQTALAEGNAQGALGRFIARVRAERERAAELTLELTQTLLAEIHRFNVRPVMDFIEAARQTFPPDMTATIVKETEPAFERIRHWRTELEPVTRERLAREARAAVTLADVRQAARQVDALIRRGGEAHRDKLSRYAVEALGRLARDYEKSRQAFAAVFDPKRGAAPSFDWEELLLEVRGRPGGGYEESDREWTQALGAAAVSVRELLPGRRELGEPTEEQLAKFQNEAAALLNGGLISGDDNDFIDALQILRDYCPTDPSTIPSLAGVEPRIFLDLSNKARLTTVRALAKLGESELLCAQILRLAKSPEGNARMPLLAAIMGGLRNEAFGPWLAEEFKKTSVPRDQERLIEAMSRIGSPAAIDLILGELAKCAKKIIEPLEVRRARALLTNLGRVVRAKGVTSEQRNRLITRAVQLVGDKDLALSIHAASQLFVNRVDELDPQLREWAAKILIQGLFGRDQGDNLKSTNESPLGFREPIVAALARMGKDMLPTILSAAEPYAARYSGAVSAFAELMGRIGDPRALPLLERMVLMLFNHADSPDDPVLLQEKFRDAASGEMLGLNRDDMIHTLLFTIEKIGGEPGGRILLEFADRVQAGQLQTPGEGTSGILLKAKRADGSLGKRSESVERAPAETVPPAELAKAVKVAKGGLFTKPAQQVVALATLGRSRAPEAVPVILGHFAASEPILANAAQMALTQYVDPLPGSKEFDRLVEAIFAQERVLKGVALERLLALIEKRFPKRAPFDGLYTRRLGTIGDGALRHRLGAAILIGDVERASNIPAEVDGAEPPRPGQSAGGSNAAAATAKGLKLSDADRKRFEALERKEKHKIYLEAKRIWLRNGSQGPEPQPPE